MQGGRYGSHFRNRPIGPAPGAQAPPPEPGTPPAAADGACTPGTPPRQRPGSRIIHRLAPDPSQAAGPPGTSSRTGHEGAWLTTGSGGSGLGPAVLVILAAAPLGAAAAAAIWPGPCGDAMRDGAGPPANRVPAAARARGVTDEGLAPVRGVGTGYGGLSELPPRDPGEPAEPLSPRLAPASSHPICYGTRGGLGRFTSRPACLLGEGGGDVLTRPAVQVQDGPFWPSDRTRLGAAGGPRCGERGTWRGPRPATCGTTAIEDAGTGHIASPHGGAYGGRYRISSR
jgi:hypothetical protein